MLGCLCACNFSSVKIRKNPPGLKSLWPKALSFIFAAIMEIIGYLGAILIGVSLGLIGGGGSILTVPLLTYVFGMDPVLATGYSLIVVGVAAAVGGFSSLKAGNVDMAAVLGFGIPSTLSVFLTRRYLVPFIPDTLWEVEGVFTLEKGPFLLLLFAVLMAMASYKMIWGKAPERSQNTSPIRLAAQGLFVGLVTGVVGAGGGFIIVPALVVLSGLDMKKAVGSSLMIIAINSTIGALGDVANPELTLDFEFLSIIIGLAVLGIVIGKALSKRISGAKLKPIFGYFIIVASVGILAAELLKITS